jgi:hypothetical protein
MKGVWAGNNPYLKKKLGKEKKKKMRKKPSGWVRKNLGKA